VNARGKHFAALLAVNGSALSFASAGAGWDLCEDGGRRVHVTVIGRGGRRERPGLVIHRCRLTDDEIVRRDGLVLTSPERTLLDLAGTLSVTALEQCLVRAVALRRFDRRALDGLIERSPHRAGVPSLRQLLTEWDGRSAPARSALEEQFLDLCRRAGLPHPEVNTRIEGFEVDFAWPAQRLIVEVDGYAFHGGPAAFERDRARDAALLLAGWRVLRFTWRQVTREPERVAAVVRRSMAR
jgi:very-short-patch-repair endonuclease